LPQAYALPLRLLFIAIGLSAPHVWGTWGPAPKDGAGAGAAFWGEGTLVSVPRLGVNLLPRPLLALGGLVLLLELRRSMLVVLACWDEVVLPC